LAADVEQLLLCTVVSGRLVILGNIAVHKRLQARALIESAGYRRHLLLPSSPGCTPIEPTFTKIKPHCAAATTE
jgi:hypothetical protein